ncbi:MAG: rod shape-determining protein MreC [Chloroflexi bacterium]|nr:rod shape-determining protein MreC [Chloroflexota bacterium]
MTLRAGRVFTFGLTLVAVMVVIALSRGGVFGPLESVVAVPLNFVQDAVSGASRGVSNFTTDIANFRRLEQRNRDLEEALAVYQSELAALREKGHDYDRLAALLDYDRQGPEDREYVTCDVIGRDTSGFVRAIQIDCGRRDGVDIFDPVVTELGMVGRVVKISATGAEVLLLTDLNSSVNARLQDSRADGLVVGQLAGDLLMQYIPVTAGVSEGDLVVTNGLGQNFPADLLLGRVMSVSLSQNELYQEARVRSLVDFDRLEIVQVVVNFEPVDLAVFGDQTEGAATP